MTMFTPMYCVLVPMLRRNEKWSERLRWLGTIFVRQLHHGSLIFAILNQKSLGPRNSGETYTLAESRAAC